MRDWLGGIVGSGEGYASFVRRRALRRWALISAAIIGLVAIAVVGYAIGASQVDDAASARQEGMTAGSNVEPPSVLERAMRARSSTLGSVLMARRITTLTGRPTSTRSRRRTSRRPAA